MALLRRRLRDLHKRVIATRTVVSREGKPTEILLYAIGDPIHGCWPILFGLRANVFDL